MTIKSVCLIRNWYSNKLYFVTKCEMDSMYLETSINAIKRKRDRGFCIFIRTLYEKIIKHTFSIIEIYR